VYFLETFLRVERGSQWAEEKFSGGQGSAADRRTHMHLCAQDLRYERQLGRGIRMCEAAADRAAITRLYMADPCKRLAQKRHALDEDIVARNVALSGARANARCLVYERNEFEGSDLIDVDEPRWPRETHRHHRSQALSARNQLDIVAVLAQQFARFAD